MILMVDCALNLRWHVIVELVQTPKVIQRYLVSHVGEFPQHCWMSSVTDAELFLLDIFVAAKQLLAGLSHPGARLEISTVLLHCWVVEDSQTSNIGCF